MNIEMKKERILERAKELMKDCDIWFDVCFSLTGGTIAGRAYYGRRLIKLNPLFLEDNFDTMINQTLPHEVCHLIAYDDHGDAGKGHGKW